MTFQAPSLLFLTAVLVGATELPLVLAQKQLAAAGGTDDRWDQAQAKELATAEPDERHVIFKVRDSVTGTDPRQLLVMRLATGSRSALSWRPAKVHLVFEHPAPRVKADVPHSAPEQIYVSDVPSGMTVDRAVALLMEDPRVEYAQPDYVRETHGPVNDPFFHSSGSWGQPYADMWALQKLNLVTAWDISRGEGLVVAVVDSGVDYLHPELASRMWINPDETGEAPDNGFPGDLHGWDFVSNDNDPQDYNGHGTMMAGIIAAADNNQTGMVGVAPGARIMAVRSINDAGSARSSTLAAGIVYAAKNGANVIAVSSGCLRRCPSDPLVEHAVRRAAAVGAVVVVSAGNRGDDLAFYSPQNMIDPRPIVVGSTDQLDRRESFSNFGEFLDIVAPGGGTNIAPPSVEPILNILSLAARFCAPSICDPAFLVGGSAYVRRGGTSMSAAYVSGLVALIFGSNQVAHVDAVRRRLFGNAVDLGPRGHDPMFGWGRITGLDTVADLRRFNLARILIPTNGQVVSGLVRIVGAADSRRFSAYEVSVGFGASPSTWQTSGITGAELPAPTAQGELARWNTQGLTPGTWTIRLVVYDSVGFSRVPREYRRTVTVTSTTTPPQLVVDIRSVHEGAGSVHVDPPRAFCDGFPGSTQTCSYFQTPGTPVTLTPFADDQSGAWNWTGACSGYGGCTVDITGLHEVGVTFGGPFKQALELRSVNNGQGHVVVDPPNRTCRLSEPCTFRYKPGTVVRLTAHPAGPLDKFRLTNEFCQSPTTCTILVRGVERILKGEFFREEDVGNPNPLQAFVDDYQRVPLGQPLHIFGNFRGDQPLTFEWRDTTTGEFLGNSNGMNVTLSLGLHDLVFTVRDFRGHSASARLRVIVTEP